MYEDSVEKMWSEYIKKNKRAKNHKIMKFSGPSHISKTIVDSIATGEKKASTSLLEMFSDESDLFESGDYSVVSDTEDKGICIVKTDFVKILKFSEMTEELAKSEAFIYKDLKMWKEIHEEFFTSWLSDRGKEFSDDMIIVFHKFTRVH